MSSKSKKNRGAAQRKKRRATSAQGAETAPPPEETPAHPEEEIVHVPKGTSPLRFVLLIGLVIVLLVIFIVPGAIYGTFSPGEDTVRVSWRMPDGEEVQVGYGEWIETVRALEDTMRVDPLLGGFFGGRSADDEGVAKFLILDRLARQSGLHVSRGDLGQHVRTLVQLYGDAERYKQATQRFGGPSRIEATMRRMLRATRFLQIGSYVGAVPGAEEIEEAWAAEHEDYAFDFVELETAALEDEAREELPDDETLQAWLEGLPEARTSGMRLPERRAAELAVFRDFESTPAAGLLERYPQVDEGAAEEGTAGAEGAAGGEGEPPAEGDPLDELAQKYHGQVAFRRFLQPPAEDGDDSADQAPSAVPFEEVEEEARAEAPVYFALQDWLDDLRGREEEGEEIDLEAEARALGLDHERIELAAREEYRDMEERRIVGDSFANAIFGLQPGGFGYVVIARPGSLAVPRVTERAEASLPPFEEIRDEVAEMWVEDRTRGLALERLRALREELSAEPPGAAEDDGGEAAGAEEEARRYASAERFRAAAEEAGLEVRHRDWSDKAAPAPDPELDAAANSLFANQRQLYALEEDEVSEPLSSSDGARVYLVRVAGRRAVPIESMSPQEFDRFRSSAAEARRREMVQGFDMDYMREAFGLVLASPAEEDEEGTSPEEEGEPEE